MSKANTFLHLILMSRYDVCGCKDTTRGFKTIPTPSLYRAES